jgi:hypothetical protein
MMHLYTYDEMINEGVISDFINENFIRKIIRRKIEKLSPEQKEELKKQLLPYVDLTINEIQGKLDLVNESRNQQHKDIDPYDEEIWDEDIEQERRLARERDLQLARQIELRLQRNRELQLQINRRNRIKDKIRRILGFTMLGSLAVTVISSILLVLLNQDPSVKILAQYSFWTFIVAVFLRGAVKEFFDQRRRGHP